MTPRQFETEYAGLWNELEQLLDQLEGRGNASTRRVGFGRRDTALPGARLAALYGPGATLELLANEPRGVVARIRVPRAQDLRAAAAPVAA